MLGVFWFSVLTRQYREKSTYLVVSCVIKLGFYHNFPPVFLLQHHIPCTICFCPGWQYKPSMAVCSKELILTSTDHRLFRVNGVDPFQIHTEDISINKSLECGYSLSACWTHMHICTYVQIDAGKSQDNFWEISWWISGSYALNLQLLLPYLRLSTSKKLLSISNVRIHTRKWS